MIKAMRALKQFMRQQAQVHPDEQELIARGEQFQKGWSTSSTKMSSGSVPLNRAPPVPQIPQAQSTQWHRQSHRIKARCPCGTSRPRDGVSGGGGGVRVAGRRNVDRLSFVAGDRISVIEAREAGGWWLGSLNGQRGWFPSAYCASRTAPRPQRGTPSRPLRRRRWDFH